MTELDPELYGIKPEQAKHRLDFMGFDQSKWDKIMKRGLDGSKFGSHEVRALITIARGKKPRLLGEVYREMRKEDNLSEER